MFHKNINMERQIGEVFKYNGITLEVVESKNTELKNEIRGFKIECKMCFFKDKPFSFCSKIKCAKHERLDCKNVYFIPVINVY